MSVSSGHRTTARRAVDDDAVLAELDLLDADDDRISVTSLVRQAASVVVLAVLGIVVVGGVSAASAPYSSAVSSETTSVVGAPDTSRGAPGPVQLPETGSAPQEETAANGSNDDLSRNALRQELLRTEAEKAEAQRQQQLQQSNEQVSTAVQEAQSSSRSESLSSTNAQIAEEEKRRLEEAARLEAERLAAEAAAQKAGTLKQSTAAPAPVDPKLAAALPAAGNGSWTTPMLPGSYVRGAGWGAVGSWARYHTGVDLSAPLGTPIRAVGDGVVVASTGGGWAGIHVVIKHADGGETLYAHMGNKVVQPGTVVKAGQLIGYVGLTGRTFGPHCHFEYYPPGVTAGDVYSTQDPAAYMLRHGVRL